MTLDFERFEKTPLVRQPFEYIFVPGFVPAKALKEINEDAPNISKPGSFPLSEVNVGPKFKEFIDELNGAQFREAFERKFDVDLSHRPSMITVRGRCSEKDGKIHTDSNTKIITVLIYLNTQWESSGGCLRLLRGSADLDDVILEVPPANGNLLAFKRGDNSWHGHKPFVGARLALQFNWVTDEEVVRREQGRHRFSATMKKIFGTFASGR